ncbi:MAG: peptide chain release factor N(5)-glutamine methyltransferase [Thiobacillaceae bacterium]
MNYPGDSRRVKTVREILERDAPQLSKTSDLDWSEARLEIRILLESVLEADRAWLLAHEAEEVQAELIQRYEQLFARRLAGEPIAYIVGQREFYGRLFKVGPDVLIPRPETELLVELAIECLPETRSADVLDLGTGSGCIAITLALERPASHVVGVDASQSSLELAMDNAAALGARVEWQCGNWYSDLKGRRFDLIVSNPPYVEENDIHLESGDVRFEPRHALSSGPMGLNDLVPIIQQAQTHLKPGGWLLLEHGWDQGPSVLGLMKSHGFEQIETYKDYAGHDRVSLGKCRKI